MLRTITAIFLTDSVSVRDLWIGSVLCSEKEFLDKIDGIVWNRYYEPDEFEVAWKQLIDEYDLQGNKWLADIEIYAACVLCDVCTISESEGVKTYGIKDKTTMNRTFTVIHNVLTNNAECSCKNFQRIGIICRHIFLALKTEDVVCIPKHFIMRRWTKDAVHQKTCNPSLSDQGSDDLKSNLNELWMEFNGLIKCVGCDNQLIKDLLDVIRNFKSQKLPETTHMSKTDLFEKLIGSPRPSEIVVQPQQQAKNKGSGKRLKSDREKITEQAKRHPRKCRVCNQMVNHDSRNCPDKKNKC
uniref:SWIM-type domain-containing protein n=1 Tax=Kalanchoe fedtschenkoi TaxID=63787 RepID=A0A7N0TJF3_KALFE